MPGTRKEPEVDVVKVEREVVPVVPSREVVEQPLEDESVAWLGAKQREREG